MRQRSSTAATRIIKRLPTATLLAAALLSYPCDARGTKSDKPANATTEPTETFDEPTEAAEASPAEEPKTEAQRMLEQILKDNPDLDPAILDQIKSQLEGVPKTIPFDDDFEGDYESDDALEEPYVPPVEEEAPLDAEALIAAEKLRKEAEALIADLAKADEQGIQAIEASLAELGEASLVPLKLAALSDDFDLRTRAGAMARRLRWRLVCTESLLNRHADLPEVMAGEEGKPRREMLDAIAGNPSSSDVPLFVECLADRDQYIRERGIDGLVLIGKNNKRSGAAYALQQAALNSDDKSVVLLSVAGLGEIEQVDIDVLTELFEKTEHGEVQRTILVTAGYSGNEKAIGLIERALKDPRWRVRAAGLEALEDIYRYAEDKDLGPIVAPLLTDPEPFIRANALRLVAELKMPGAADTIWKLIEDGTIEKAMGIETLATLQDGKAYGTLAESYEAATTAGEHDEALRWLTYLNDYEKNPDVDSRLMTILQDSALRPQWATAIYLASRRRDDEQFVPIVAPMLLDEDQEIRTSVWSGFGRYTMDDYELPAELDKGLANGDTEQRLWRIKLLYQTIDITKSTALYDALNDTDPAVVSLALAMIGDLLISDSLGEDDLPYRSSVSDYAFLETGLNHQLPEAKPGLNDETTKQVLAVLGNEDPLARVRAAALLYATEKDRGDQVTQQLRDAIRSDEPHRIAPALSAATYELGDLVKDVDLVGLADQHPGDAYLLANLCSIMLQVGEKGMVDKALAISAGFELYRHEEYFIGLVKSGSEPAIELVKRKVLEEGDYYGRRMIEKMVPTSPDAAIEIGAALLDSPSLDSYDRQDIINNLVRTKKNEKLIPLLKEQIKLALASSDQFDRSYAQQYQQILLSIDPDSAKEEIIGALETGSDSEQRQAITTVTQMPQPSEQIVAMVLETVLKREAEVDPSWSLLVGWLAAHDKQPELEQAIDTLPGVIQSALLAEMAKTLRVEDIDRLLAIEAASADARDRITKMLALLLTKHPEARPASLDGLSPAARALLLPTLGQWPGGVEQLQPWLDHEDLATAEAALRGLAIAHLFNPPQALAEADAARFAKGVASDDAATAYLSAEALYQLAPEQLRAVDAAEASSTLALLRIASTGGSDDKGPAADAVKTALTASTTAGESSESRLALLAAIQTGRDKPFQRAWQRGQLQYSQQDLLPQALDAFPTRDMLYQAVYFGLLSADDPIAREVFDKTKDQASNGPSMVLGMFFDRGFITAVPLDQLETYLKSASQWAMQGEVTTGASEFISRFDAEPAAVKAELVKLMQDEPSLGLYTALLLFEYDRDEAALTYIRDMLANLSIAQIDRRGVSQEHYQAIAALAHTGGKENKRVLMALFDKLSKQESWQAQSLGMTLLDTLVPLDAQAVRAYYEANKDRPEDELYIFYEGNSFSAVDLLNALAIDDPASDGATPMIKQDYAELSEALTRIKNTGQAGGRMASPPWDYNGNLDSYTTLSRDDFVRLDLELTLEWVQTGEVNENQSDDYYQVAYEYQDTVWGLDQPVFEQRMALVSAYNYDTSAVFLNPLDRVDTPSFYAALDYMSAPVTLSGLREEAIQQLAPLLGSEDVAAASRAARVAAAWRAVSLGEQLTGMIARPDDAGREAAWASARLFGPEATQAILDRAKASEDYDERVELACLLVLLGEETWAQGVIDQAQELLNTQQLLGRTIQPVQQFYDPRQQGRGSDIYYDEWEYRRGYGSSNTNESIADGRMASSTPAWEGLLATAQGPADEASMQRKLGLLPAIGRPQLFSPQADDADQPLGLRHDLSYGLSFENAATNQLPLPELVGLGGPPLMHLEQQESALFNVALTQLAEEGQTHEELALAWKAWLEAHGDDAPEARWSAGVASAIQAMTDPRWWRRSLARERLQRLTGQAIEPPVLFDLDQWASLQSQWQSWADSEQAASPRAALSAVAVEAGLVDAAPTNEAEELAMLVRMAGWGDPVQSTAALHRLELWPDADALIKAAASWQTSPRGPLRAWYLQRASDQPRLFVPAE